MVGVSGLRGGKEPFEVRADVVVGADGRFSQVRRLGGFEVEYEQHDFDVIWFVIERPAGLAQHHLRVPGRGRAGAHPPEVPERAPGRASHAPEGWRRWREAGVAAVAERIRRLDPIFKGFADGLTDFTPFFPLQG